MDLAYKAMVFAMEAHKNQKRKYTGNPYTDHLAEVAGIVATIDNSNEVIAAAWLHDVIEDCGVNEKDLNILFGNTVSFWVKLLSDTETGNRAERKRKSRERLSESPACVQNIKVADLISNTSSIVQHDHKFAKVYLEEKRLLLDVLKAADERLLKIAKYQCEVTKLTG
jgi:GTP diphosphokinase / guanosine-3',5'-bis(diphosphate) 3'-diphosphatase